MRRSGALDDKVHRRQSIARKKPGFSVDCKRFAWDECLELEFHAGGASRASLKHASIRHILSMRESTDSGILSVGWCRGGEAPLKHRRSLESFPI